MSDEASTTAASVAESCKASHPEEVRRVARGPSKQCRPAMRCFFVLSDLIECRGHCHGGGQHVAQGVTVCSAARACDSLMKQRP